MRFARAFGGEFMAAWDAEHGEDEHEPTPPPGQFYDPFGVAVVRGLLVVSDSKRLQVLTPKGVPLQVLALGEDLRGLCADAQRVWVAGSDHQVHVLRL